MDKPNWLNVGDIGYIIDDNHVDGPFLYNVIYPDDDFEGTFCLYPSAMIKEQTMIDILPDWEEAKANEEYGYVAPLFEELYKNKYSEINNVFYKNLTFYGDILLYKKNTKYYLYKIWFSKDKKLITKLWNFILNKKISDIKRKFGDNYDC